MTTERDRDQQDHADLSYTDEQASRIESDPIRITLSGHTCAGKTEWLSSLLCSKVGEISPSPDTTQEIEWRRWSLAGSNEDAPYIEIADVPGQQFSSEILQQAQNEKGPRPRSRQMEKFIEEHKEAEGDHQSDIRLLDHFRGCDVILYLADCQDTPAIAIEDEFELVRRLERPVIAVLNFSAPHVQTDRSTLVQWREAFEGEGARSVVELDAFDKDPAAIRALGCQLAAVFHDRSLKARFMKKYWQEEVIAKEDRRIDEAINTLAEFLVNAATYVVREPLGKGAGQKATEKRVKAEYQKFTSKKLAELPDAIAEAYPEFASALKAEGNPDAGRPGVRSKHHAGPFGGALLNQSGKSLGRGAVIGGLFGLVVDAMVGGLSSGGGAMLGASIGATVDVGFSLQVRKTWIGRLGSCIEVQLAERTVGAWCVDGLAWLDALRRRGVANNAPLNFKQRRKCIPDPVEVMKMLNHKRAKHAWSRWAGNEKPSSRRQAFVDELALELRDTLDQAGDAPVRGKAAMTKAASSRLNQLTGLARRGLASVRADRGSGQDEPDL